jgi:glycosyltransferase involved in cell wall biosynthesis
MTKANKKIAIIVQRYGEEVNGGAEVHAKLIAEKLNKKYDVTILTSRAINYQTWKPEYNKGECYVNEIKVIRFNNQIRGSRKLQKYFSKKNRGRLKTQIIYNYLGCPKWWLKLFPNVLINKEDFDKWLEAQGPAMPDLLDFLTTHRDYYDVFIFFTMLYYPTAKGLPLVSNKSILIPTLHDENDSYIPGFKEMMALPQWIMYNTISEKSLAHNLFQINDIKNSIAGVGVRCIADEVLSEKDILNKYKITTSYIIYVGRIHPSKGCENLFDYFLKYFNKSPANTKLILCGKAMMDIPIHPSLINLGFVSDEDKDQLILNSRALIIPSLHESLSLVLLESFGCKVPVIANGKCEVLRDHINQSNGGWLFYDYDSFENIMMHDLFDEKSYNEKGINGYKYVKKKYSWDRVMECYDKAIQEISQEF